MRKKDRSEVMGQWIFFILVPAAIVITGWQLTEGSPPLYLALILGTAGILGLGLRTHMIKDLFGRDD